jgi:predicted adenine nucleotide alpha hydrolase (AANH) superfamily ATPase
MKILLHTCCGPCTIYPLKKLRADNHEVCGYFNNPNIHPYTEWQQRKETLLDYARDNDLKVIVNEDYDLEGYLREVVHRESVRCRYCYTMRLRQAARIARRGKFDAFSTTLLVSPFQKHDLIAEIGRAMGEEAGVPFYYEDFRPGYREATEISWSLNMYRQQYCGCIYSERDRYDKLYKNKSKTGGEPA